MTPANDSYLEALKSHAVRVLSLMDRDPFSPTFGCMDRTFWSWKFVDFPGARFQEGLCFLGFLYATEFEGSPYFRSPKLLKWIAGGLDFWARIQRPTGDFDEAYPFERSLAATAFTSFYLSEAWNFVGQSLPESTVTRFQEALTLAGDWLIRNDETHGFLSNHLAAAAAALLHISRITDEDRFAVRSRYFVNKILAHQSDEGWYEEYGGADPGYQTHGSFYLTRIAQLTQDKRLFESLEQSFTFLAHFVHPDGSLGGEYTSRNTQTYYPAAFEISARNSPTATWIAEAMRPSVSSLAAAGLGTVDIYNFFPLLNNTVFAYLGSLGSDTHAYAKIGPSSDPGEIFFPQAGLLKVRRPNYDLYIGVNKGGVFKLFDRTTGNLILSNCGYIGRLKSGKTFSNQWVNPESVVEVNDSDIRIEGTFCQTARPVMDPWRFLAFRGFSLTIGRFRKAAYWLKALLVKTLITRKRDLSLRFERRIRLTEASIVIEDYIQGTADSIQELSPGENFTTIHMGSSRYFVPNELVEPPTDDFWRPIDPDALEQGVSRTLTIQVGGEIG